MKELSIFEFINQCVTNSSALICGNGFSMNFDDDFGNIYDRLYASHKELVHNSEYEVKSNKKFTKKCLDNYKGVIQHLRNISESNLHKVFADGLIFAESIKNNKQLIDDLRKKGYITELVFGISQIDIVNQMCDVGMKKGIRYVNIEFWTILIYFYFAIKKLSPQYYSFPSNNLFLTVVNTGDRSKILLISDEDDIYQSILFNGFSTYYRLLFSIAIFSKGKALELNKLENIANLDIEKIKDFLMMFGSLISLNYDKIMENIAGTSVEHFHGQFIRNKEYVYYQSLGLNYDKGYISFSDLMLGDYFTFKTLLPVINNLSRGGINKDSLRFSDKMDNLIKNNSINNVVIFGMNIENDQHVLRNLMLGFYNARQQAPHIIYCYFTNEEKESFKQQFDAVITFSKEVSEYACNIDVSFIKTQDLLKEYFYKS
ncbi:hypothetical protein [Paenibacillus aquistagni]|uniref:SIR2-like domain-containing protein n=1 Tax=Paenibacillus aquistagni TaxID=1852522 RepID=A0A1X7LP86_9BACL|nr:hypothetical protein [Paenibacillus aquistagni]SMG55294.1 hypothetical protein SAMN06295960_3861 [Paenibacillus aquistagni]